MDRNKPSVVLVVDDAPVNIVLLQGILTSAEYRVISTSDGPTALALAQSEQPDLVLLDVAMPDMDGFAVCTRLKEMESTRNIPVIFVTAWDNVQAEVRGFATGAVDYITKPFTRATVLARVKAHLATQGHQRRLEDQFREVIEFAPDAYILLDREGKIVQVNSRAEQLFGYHREELIAQPAEILIPPRQHKNFFAYRRYYFDKPRRLPTPKSSPCVRKDATEFFAEINLSPLNTRGGTLLMAVVRDVTFRRNSEMELRASRQRLRELMAQNEAIREGERKHVAREIHDELGQVLTALRMDVSLLDMRFGTQNPALAEKTADMKGLIDRAIQGVRNVAVHLRPTSLDMGLLPAIEWLSSEFTARTGVPCAIDVHHRDVELDEARAVVVFRLVQESLTNIGRYASATHVNITLTRRNDALWLEVRDDGCGFDLAAATQRRSFGLLGMRERAIALGGSVHIHSALGKGTAIALTIPFDIQAKKENP